MQSAVRADGLVTRLIKNKEKDSRYNSVVTFRSTDNRSREFVSTFAMYPAPYKIGENVKVIYPPEHPEKAVLDTFFDVWGVATIIGILAGGQLIAGLAFLLVPIAIQKYRRVNVSGGKMDNITETDRQ